ncbi:hypothetical protein VTK56DRAFT_659 [Thermocarpiscus australiensis]
MSRLRLQSPVLQTAVRRPTSQLMPRCVPATTTTTKLGAARTFSHLPTLRPTLPTPQTTTTAAVFRAPNQTLLQPALQLQQHQLTGTMVDLVAKSSISSHPALAGPAAQIRCGPRATMSNASRLVQKRRHGFLSRIRTHSGRKTLARRRAKGRKRMCAL